MEITREEGDNHLGGMLSRSHVGRVHPYMNVASFMGYLKSEYFNKHANFKYKYGNLHTSGARDIVRMQWERIQNNCKIHSKSAEKR